MGNYLGDLEKTQFLQGLFETPANQRDQQWKDKFLSNVSDASFACGDPQVITGPDQFPYFQLRIPEPYKQFQCFVIRHMKDDFLLEQGLGVVLNAHKGQPDWVFSSGDIVNLHLRNEFYSQRHTEPGPAVEVLQQEEQVFVGQPSEEMLPSKTRHVIQSWLSSQGIAEAKVLLMKRGNDQDEELVFNLQPDMFPSPEYFESIMNRLTWFLPRHYSVLSMREASMPGSFAPL